MSCRVCICVSCRMVDGGCIIMLCLQSTGRRADEGDTVEFCVAMEVRQDGAEEASCLLLERRRSAERRCDFAGRRGAPSIAANCSLLVASALHRRGADQSPDSNDFARFDSSSMDGNAVHVMGFADVAYGEGTDPGSAWCATQSPSRIRSSQWRRGGRDDERQCRGLRRGDLERPVRGAHLMKPLTTALC